MRRAVKLMGVIALFSALSIPALAQVDGSKNPERIPQNAALSLFLRTFAEPVSIHTDNFNGMVRKIGLSQPDRDALVAIMEQFATQHDNIEMAQGDRPKDDMPYWNSVISLTGNTAATINKSLSAAGQLRFWNFIEREKAGMSIAETNPELGPSAIAARRKAAEYIVASRHSMPGMPQGNNMIINYSAYMSSYWTFTSQQSTSTLTMIYEVSGTTSCPNGCPPNAKHTGYAALYVNGSGTRNNSGQGYPTTYLQTGSTQILNFSSPTQVQVSTQGSVLCTIVGTIFNAPTSGSGIFNGYLEIAFTYFGSNHTVVGTHNGNNVYTVTPFCSSTYAPPDDKATEVASPIDAADPNGWVTASACGRFTKTTGTPWICSSFAQPFLNFPVTEASWWPNVKQAPLRICTNYDKGAYGLMTLPIPWPVFWPE